MKILLINVCLRYDNPLKLPPVGLACIATALKNAGFKPDILDIDLHRYSDAEIIKYLENNSYDIIGLGNIISGYSHTKRLSNVVKQVQPTTILVVGNTVASIPEQLLRWNPGIDIAVLGEGDVTIVDLVHTIVGNGALADVDGIAFRNGDRIIRTQDRAHISKMEDIPFPNFALFEIDEYLKVSYKTVPEPHPIPVEKLLTLPVNTARGCPYNCSFCYHAFKDCPYRFYPFDLVLKEYKRLQDNYGIKYLNFWDELTLVSRKRAFELCEAIQKSQLEVYWPIGPRANLFKKNDFEFLKKCKELGAHIMGGALESADEEILQAMNKKISPGDFIEQMTTARRAGIQPVTSLVFGYPQETKATIKRTIEVCKQAGVYPSVGFVLPLPNTPIYQYSLSHGYITDEEEYLLRIADRQDLHVNLTSISNEELFDTVREELIKLKNYLGIPLLDKDVIKTTIYKAGRRQEGEVSE